MLVAGGTKRSNYTDKDATMVARPGAPPVVTCGLRICSATLSRPRLAKKHDPLRARTIHCKRKRLLRHRAAANAQHPHRALR